jgi:hypothetical protein
MIGFAQSPKQPAKVGLFWRFPKPDIDPSMTVVVSPAILLPGAIVWRSHNLEFDP